MRHYNHPHRAHCSYHQPQPATRCAYRTHFADLAHRTLVLGVIFRTIEGAGKAGLASVNGRVRGAADVEFAKSVEFDLEGVVGRALADGFDLSCLECR
jgi:hypothetical protein